MKMGINISNYLMIVATLSIGIITPLQSDQNHHHPSKGIPLNTVPAKTILTKPGFGTVLMNTTTIPSSTHHPHNLNGKPKLVTNYLNLTVTKPLPISEGFHINQFECTADPKVCQQVREGYQLATTRLSAVLNLIQPIQLQVIWKDLCQPDELNDACERQTICRASPSTFWSVESITNVNDGTPLLDPKYMYPQALVKQYTQTLDFLPYDIIIEHDARQRSKVWFQDDGPIGDEQFEFEYLVLHELLHGLGILSSFDQYLEKDKEVLLPNLQINPTNQNIMGIKKPFIFDKYLAYGVIADARIRQWLDTIGKVSNRLGELPRPQWEEQFLNSEAGKCIRELYRIATTPQSMFFLLPNVNSTNATTSTSNTTTTKDVTNNLNKNNDTRLKRRDDPDLGLKSEGDQQDELKTSFARVTLHTPHTFVSGASIAHLDLIVYQDTADFILRPIVSYGHVLLPKGADEYPIGTVEGSFGPGLINILQTLGYQIKPEVSQFTQSMLTGSPPASHALPLIPFSFFPLLLSLPLLLILTSTM